MTGSEIWGHDRIDEFVAMVRGIDDFHDLSRDEVLSSCHDRGGTVLHVREAGAAAVVIGREGGGDLVASIRILVPVATDSPEDLERRIALLRAVEEHVVGRGVARIVLGGGLPFALTPGVVDGSADMAAARACGYVVGRSWSSWTLPTTVRFDAPPGVAVRRAVHDDDVATALVAVASSWPRRSDEVARALDHGTCHVAFADDGRVLGLVGHSIARAGWLGPLLVLPEDRRRGIGSALVGQVCRDLMIAEFHRLVVAEACDDGATSFVVALGGAEHCRFVEVERRV